MIAAELKVPKPVKLITAGADFQIDRSELEFVGWGEGEESWGLGYHILYGDFSVMQRKGEPWAFDQIEQLMTREFIREDGARLKVCAAAFDIGYSHVERALIQYLRPRLIRRYYPTRGAGGPHSKWAPIYAKGRRQEKILQFIVGTNRAKQLWYRRATIGVAGPGYIHIPKTDDYNEEWFKQFLAEDSHTERDRGIEMQIFEMPKTPKEGGTDRNEALDIRVGALVALYIRSGGSINWEFEEKQNLKTIPPKDGKVRPAETAAPRRDRKQSNWLNWQNR